MTDRIEIYRSRLRRWRWRYRAANGHVLADSGQGYSRRIDALNGAAVVTGALHLPAEGAAYGEALIRASGDVRVVEVDR